MQKYEPDMWRTDLVLFLERDEKVLNESSFIFNRMNCSFENVRTSEYDEPMCTLVEFVSLQKRNIKQPELNIAPFYWMANGVRNF